MMLPSSVVTTIMMTGLEEPPTATALPRSGEARSVIADQDRVPRVASLIAKDHRDATETILYSPSPAISPVSNSIPKCAAWTPSGLQRFEQRTMLRRRNVPFKQRTIHQFDAARFQQPARPPFENWICRVSTTTPISRVCRATRSSTGSAFPHPHRLLAGSDVEAESDLANRRTVGTGTWHTLIDEPAENAVVATVAEELSCLTIA